MAKLFSVSLITADRRGSIEQIVLSVIMLFSTKIQTLVSPLYEEEGLLYAQTFMDWPAGWSIFVTAVDGPIRRNNKIWAVGNNYHH